jgi:hypothetical protein
LFSFFFPFQTSDFREKDFLLHVFELQFTSQKSSKIGFDTATRQRRERERERERERKKHQQHYDDNRGIPGNKNHRKQEAEEKPNQFYFLILKNPVNLMKLLKTLKNSKDFTELPKKKN